MENTKQNSDYPDIKHIFKNLSEKNGRDPMTYTLGTVRKETHYFEEDPTKKETLTKLNAEQVLTIALNMAQGICCIPSEKWIKPSAGKVITASEIPKAINGFNDAIYNQKRTEIIFVPPSLGLSVMTLINHEKKSGVIIYPGDNPYPVKLKAS